MCPHESAVTLTLAAVAVYFAAGCAVPQGLETDGLLQLSAEVLRTAGLLEPSSYNSRSWETVSLLAKQDLEVAIIHNVVPICCHKI